MLRLTKLTDYAVVVLCHMAGRGEAGACTARDVAEATRIPQPTVSKVLKQLVREGLVDSLRGAKGGYRLARPAADVSVAEVIAAVEGPIGVTECTSEESGCEHEPTCSVRENWHHINRVIRDALSKVSLAEMARPGAGPALVQIGARSSLAG
jgi:FeS assembly SUF system regulator